MRSTTLRGGLCKRSKTFTMSALASLPTLAVRVARSCEGIVSPLYPPTSLIPLHLPLWSVPLLIGRPYNADALATLCFRSVGREDGKSYAVKVILLEKTREDKSQIKTLGEVNHPGIIKLVDWFETPST